MTEQKIQKLNKKQIKLMDEVKQEWINLILHSAKDLKIEDVENDIEKIYQKIKREKPIILIADSWLVQQYMINLIFGEKDKEQSQVRSQVWSQVRSQVESQVESQVWSQVGSQVWSQVGSQVWSQVRSQVWSQVRSQVGSQVESQVRSQVRSQDLYFANQCFGLGEDCGWLSFYDYFSRLNLLQSKDFDFVVGFYKKGIWNVVFTENFVFICKLPKEVHQDQQGRPHSEIGGAIKWRDGIENYFIHGVGFEKELWIKIVNDKLTCEEILKLENIEQRYVALMMKGAKNLLTELDAKLIDSSERGNELYIIENIIRNRTLKLLKYKCPSTGRIYISFVPDEFTDADKSMAWKFQIEPIEYQRIVKET